MPKTQTGICEPNDFYVRMKKFIGDLDGREFTMRDLFSATNVPYGLANAFLRVSFMRGELVRTKRNGGKSQRCYHYKVSEAGLRKGTASKGEVASLVWKAMQRSFPDFLPPIQVSHNIRHLSGRDYHRCCVTRLLLYWFNHGHLEKLEGRTRKQNGYRIKAGVINRPPTNFKTLSR